MSLIVYKDPLGLPIPDTEPGRESQVRRCALFLDDIRPAWMLQVDPETLDFSDDTMCVVGQIWGHIEKSPYWGDMAARFPKALTGGTEFWRAEIETRRAARPLRFPKEWTRDKPTPVVVSTR